MLPEDEELDRLEAVQAELQEQVAAAELTLETLKMRRRHFVQNISKPLVAYTPNLTILTRNWLNFA